MPRLRMNGISGSQFPTHQTIPLDICLIEHQKYPKTK